MKKWRRKHVIKKDKSAEAFFLLIVDKDKSVYIQIIVRWKSELKHSSKATYKWQRE